MPRFLYTTRDKEGKVVQGAMDAPDQDKLISILQSQGLIVTSVSQEERPGGIGSATRMKFHARVKLDDLAMLARQLATLLGSGITMLRSLEAATVQIESRRLYLAMEGVRRDVEAGSSLRDALAKYPKIFSEYWVGLVDTGESSGQLPKMLVELANYLEFVGSSRRKTLSAFIYPLILISIVIGAVFFFVIYVIPKFTMMFESFDVPLPLLTRMVVGLSELVRDYFLYMILFLIGIGVFTYRYIRTERGRLVFDRLKLRLPVFGRFFHQMALTRFARGLSTLIGSGVPILYGLEIMARSAGNKVVQRAIEEVKAGVRDGKTMAAPLAKNALFPPMVVQMVSVGEETGKLAEMLGQISNFYNERIETLIARLSTALEPILLVFLGAVVGTLVIAMYLPVFQIARLGVR